MFSSISKEKYVSQLRANKASNDGLKIPMHFSFPKVGVFTIVPFFSGFKKKPVQPKLPLLGMHEVQRTEADSHPIGRKYKIPTAAFSFHTTQKGAIELRS